MSDDGMPYQKAIEETAKATSNAVDLIREGGRAIGPAIGDIYGLLIGDKVSAARARRLEEIAHKATKKLEDRHVADRLELPEDIAIPLLEAAQGEPRDELQELWARLLANAMDPKRSNNVRAEFIEIVRKFEPIEARVFFNLHTVSGDNWPVPGDLAKVLSLRETAVQVSVSHLLKLNCLRAHPANPSAVRLSSFGLELMYGLEP
jgi:hypothetical protein